MAAISVLSLTSGRAEEPSTNHQHAYSEAFTYCLRAPDPDCAEQMAEAIARKNELGVGGDGWKSSVQYAYGFAQGARDALELRAMYQTAPRSD